MKHRLLLFLIPLLVIPVQAGDIIPMCRQKGALLQAYLSQKFNATKELVKTKYKENKVPVLIAATVGIVVAVVGVGGFIFWHAGKPYKKNTASPYEPILPLIPKYTLAANEEKTSLVDKKEDSGAGVTPSTGENRAVSSEKEVEPVQDKADSDKDTSDTEMDELEPMDGFGTTKLNLDRDEDHAKLQEQKEQWDQIDKFKDKQARIKLGLVATTDRPVVETKNEKRTEQLIQFIQRDAHLTLSSDELQGIVEVFGDNNADNPHITVEIDEKNLTSTHSDQKKLLYTAIEKWANNRQARRIVRLKSYYEDGQWSEREIRREVKIKPLKPKNNGHRIKHLAQLYDADVVNEVETNKLKEFLKNKGLRTDGISVMNSDNEKTVVILGWNDSKINTFSKQQLKNVLLESGLNGSIRVRAYTDGDISKEHAFETLLSNL